ncbi:MAG: threonine synthase [Vulcanimicrobiaceae bacterium]
MRDNVLDSSGVWRFRELLPQIAPEHIVTLAEGNVPLYAARDGASFAKAHQVAYLHLGMNPTGSFKDLGMTVAVSAAQARGARGVVCASTGNTASSMAAYAARAGLRAYALVPRGRISAAKLAQTRDYGAEIIEVEGSFDDAFQQLGNVASGEIMAVNSTNPYRLEGQKCAAFVMLERRNWQVPDWFILPGGNLGNVSAFGKGFREAHMLGLIDRLPRIAVVQASGAAPFAHSWESQRELIPVVPQTLASAIAVGAPKSWRRAGNELRTTTGIALHVSDDEIDAAKSIIGLEGIGCEPASAASLAGLRALRARKIVGENDDIVCVLTGHVLKDSAASLRVADARDERKHHVG